MKLQRLNAGYVHVFYLAHQVLFCYGQFLSLPQSKPNITMWLFNINKTGQHKETWAFAINSPL